MSDLYESLSHSKWNCKYHVVFVTSCLCPRDDARRFSGKHVGNWDQFSMRWHGRKNAR